MSSDLTLKGGIYDPTRRFAFTNITKEDFTFTWDGQPITIKSGDTVELPHHLAVLATGRLVDDIMIGEINEATRKAKEVNPAYLAPNQAGKLGVPGARKPYEDKILKELPRDTDSSQFKILQSQAVEALKADIEKSTPAKKISKIDVNPEEFAGVKQK